MAVEKKINGGNAQPQPDESIQRLKEILESLSELEKQPNIDDKQIQDHCNQIIVDLVFINIPAQANAIKDVQLYLASITQLLECLIRKSSASEQIYINCLQTLYAQLVIVDNPSVGSGIIFDIYDQDTISKAIKLLIRNTANMGIDNDNDFKKVTVTLCTWLRTYSHFKNLSHCIINFLDGLRELQKFDLLMEIAENVIERICLSLIIPVVRPSTIKVFSHILCSAQSNKLFLKIESRLPNVIKAIVKNLKPNSDIPPDFQLLVDIISVFVNKFPSYYGQHDEITMLLKDFKVSDRAATMFDIPNWHPPIPKRDPSMPIGLVNLGNTCYMNSVLQALFMTKDLTHTILFVSYKSKIIHYLQQLISLLLYSVRHELSPDDVLNARPSSFRYGYQQDSFEYLGLLLDQLHEEEKRCRANPDNWAKTTNPMNGITPQLENGNCNGIKNKKHWNQDLMDVDDNNLHQSITMESPPLTDESDDAINPDASKPANGFASNGQNIETSQKSADSENETETIRTMIQNLFGGRLSINYKCLECQSESTNIDNFFDLQLSLPSQSNDLMSLPSALVEQTSNLTTQTLLNNYFTTEKMINDDKYYCDKCKSYCDGERNIILEEGPANLILVVKHFKYDRNCHARRKLLQKVHHDEYISLISKGSDSERIRSIYKMYAVIVHSGTNIDSGHYFTYGVNGYDQWFKFNDNHISHSSFNDVKNLQNLNTPYILFYELVHAETLPDNDTNKSCEIAGALSKTDLATVAEQRRKRKAEPPQWDDLPHRLKQFVESDNLSFASSTRSRYDNGSSDMVKNYYNKHKKSDNDQDPPSSCGGSIVTTSNGYIY